MYRLQVKMLAIWLPVYDAHLGMFSEKYMKC